MRGLMSEEEEKLIKVSSALRMNLRSKGYNYIRWLGHNESHFEINISNKDILMSMDEKEVFEKESYEYYKASSKIILIKSVGCFLIGKSINELEKLQFELNIRTIKDENRYTCDKYKNTTGKRFKDKIVIVTGGAKGIGREIVKSFVREGAVVVIADKDYYEACNLQDELNEFYRSKIVKAIETDVSSEKMIKDMVIKCVEVFGGIDILVSNAGVMYIGGIDKMDTETFEKVTRINYTAYYHCVKYTALVMKLQNFYDNDYFMDIINISSKSGLEGSYKSFAYSGSKFGTIGLTKSFALELAEYSIKVNAVCPGSVFDVPLWADPENGLFVQMLKENRIENAKSIEDLKEYYISKIPLARYCTSEDVVCAVFYAVEQKHETGQALPVTGGQIMLN